MVKKITVDNKNVTLTKALRDAEVYHKLTGKPVEVETMLGDTLVYWTNGKKYTY